MEIYSCVSDKVLIRDKNNETLKEKCTFLLFSRRVPNRRAIIPTSVAEAEAASLSDVIIFVAHPGISF